MNTQTVVERSEAVMAGTIDLLVGIEDALEAIVDSAVSREEYIHMHKPQFREAAGNHYDHACFRIRKYRTVRKALNETRRKLNIFRS